jgi:hypothetical protein
MRRARSVLLIICMADLLLLTACAADDALELGNTDRTQRSSKLEITICHHTASESLPYVTITTGYDSLSAHLGHGDTLGECAIDLPLPPDAAPAPQRDAAPALPPDAEPSHEEAPSPDAGEPDAEVLPG